MKKLFSRLFGGKDQETEISQSEPKHVPALASKRKRRTKEETQALRASEHEQYEQKVAALRALKREPEFYACLEHKGYSPHAFEQKNKMEDRYSKMASAGIKTYTWSTGPGPCPKCAEQNGKIFAVDNPPPGGHAGQAPGCMCFPTPNIGAG